MPINPKKSSRNWPQGAHEQAVALQRLLTIGERDWHAFKTQRSRRAAEQLAAALVLLLGGDDPSAAEVGQARQMAIELVSSGYSWLIGDLSDPGCPSHRPGSSARPVAD